MERNYYVYQHTRLDTNEVFYIGISKVKKYKRARDKYDRSDFWKRIVNKTKYKIDISDYYYPDIHEELEEFRRLGDDVEVVDCTKIRPGGIKDPTELLTYAHDCDALITQFAAPIDAAFMDGLEKCLSL